MELQIANGYIQWRYTTGADTAWKNLMPLSDLKGEDGEDGDTPYIGSNGNWWIGTMVPASEPTAKTVPAAPTARTDGTAGTVKTVRTARTA